MHPHPLCDGQGMRGAGSSPPAECCNRESSSFSLHSCLVEGSLIVYGKELLVSGLDSLII